MPVKKTAEWRRLDECCKDGLDDGWRKWGPYLSERQWATVREDYSADGNAWAAFPHSQSVARSYRWGEDGLAGVSDTHARVCMSIALWNEKDPILKERLFGLTGHQGNHGEDVKELYYYLDNTPTHSYMKYLYKYPQARYPYEQLVEEASKRGREEDEYEIQDTSIFDTSDYFDVFVEYAKASPDDLLMKITIHNRSDEPAPIHVLPHVWYRNVWSWRKPDEKGYLQPKLSEVKLNTLGGYKSIKLEHPDLDRYLHFAPLDNYVPELLFTNNNTNYQVVFGYTPENHTYSKDGINERVVHNNAKAVNPEQTGTKAAGWYKATIPANGSLSIHVVMTPNEDGAQFMKKDAFDKIFAERLQEADEFYDSIAPENLSNEMKMIQRQAYSGLLWSKQFFYYNIKEWLEGDPMQPSPPAQRGRNKEWRHVIMEDIHLMPDKFEYPFFANWDSAFHTVVCATIDPEFAKYQLELMTKETYMHPNGTFAAYEWAFSDLNPPVCAWATLTVYKTERKMHGREDRGFLERMFHKLLLNFTSWVTRQDPGGLNVFEGGFLGLDNISCFDRSAALPVDASLRQSDGTSWMAMYCLNMLEIALKLSEENSNYEHMASKFFEHFMMISNAMNYETHPDAGNAQNNSLWDEEDGFYYDALVSQDQTITPLKIRSLVGLIALYPCLVLEPEVFEKFPMFARRVNWFLDNWDFSKKTVVIDRDSPDEQHRMLLALVDKDKLRKILTKMFDENEFLSKHGIRSLSKFHQNHPYEYYVGSTAHSVAYWPGESYSGLFGGNSNWRGPLWMPTMYLLIQSLQRFHYFYGSSFKITVPLSRASKIGIPPTPKTAVPLSPIFPAFPLKSNSLEEETHKEEMDLWHASQEVQHRVIRIFLRNRDGKRPVYGENDLMNFDPNFRDYVLFYEYFHGDSGQGLGASHQTGWTALVAECIQEVGITCDNTGFKMPEQTDHYDRFIQKKLARIEARKTAQAKQEANALLPRISTDVK